MKDNNRRLLVPAVVIAGCLALLLLLIVLANTRGAGESNPAIGFPVVLVVLAVLAGVAAVVWRTVSRRKSSDRR